MMGRKNNKMNCVEKVGSRSLAATIWNDLSVAIFCDLCIKEVEAGHPPDTHFSKVGWKNLVAHLSKETGKDYDKPQLKNKWDSLKAEWKMWKELIGKETGLGWNPTKNTIDASDEWWHSRVQVDSNYAKFRNKGIKPEMEEKLDRMFLKTRTTREHAKAPLFGVPSESEEASKDDAIKLKGRGDSEQFIPILTTQAKKRSSGRGKRRTVQEPDTQVRKEKKGKRVAIGGRKVGGRGTVKLSEKIDNLLESVDSSSSVTFKLEEGVHGSSIPEVMQAVQSLPGAEPGSKLWLFATRLFLSEDKREMFTYMKDPDIKLQWLNYEFTEK